MRMQREQLERKLVPVNEMIAAGTVLARTVATRMLTLASKYASRLVMIPSAGEVELILRPAIEEALTELSELEVIAQRPSELRRAHS